MRSLVLRRILCPLLVLAFVAGMQIGMMPTAMAHSGMPLAGMPDEPARHDCDGCGQADAMTAACVSICAPMLVATQQTPIADRVAYPAPWTWLNAAFRTQGVEPALSPPRS